MHINGTIKDIKESLSNGGTKELLQFLEDKSKTQAGRDQMFFQLMCMMVNLQAQQIEGGVPSHSFAPGGYTQPHSNGTLSESNIYRTFSALFYTQFYVKICYHLYLISFCVEPC